MASVRDELICCICLELYTDPVTVPCGHNFCRLCIERFLDSQGFGPYNCPECRADFQQRPALQRNITLCNVVTHFRSSPRKEVSGVPCTYCIHGTVPAIQSCLHCQASMCDDHLQVHSTEPEHILTRPSTNLKNRQCPAHKEILKYYCKEDARCICPSCRLDGEHQGHPVESLDLAAGRKKEKLREVLQNLNSEREENEKKIHKLGEQRRTIRDQQAAQLVSEMIRCLEMKTMVLTQRTDRVLELCNETDALTVLLDQESELWGNTEGENDAMGDLYQGPNPEGKDLAEDILLDLSTAANNVRVSPDLRTVSWAAAFQKRPETPARFRYNQVLGSQRFTSGQHCWDVETSESGDWRIGVAYGSVDRRGDQCYLGDSSKSWCLRKLHKNQYSVMHDGKVITAPHQFLSHKFRICLDYEAGNISFYELSDPIQQLHTFTATFTEPLHAAFGVGYWLCSEESWLRVGKIET
ncbi:E3 ubiquitin/ISG15 ligase TRIM25-like [Pyxicephalus adspersus]|uniref:E3 ubiquitin/ISG15 ligase TRIM25-like n=1 Tax=Pyxicephalus adspersus TaxID=30357 RepID=UPI003B598C40